MKHVLAACTIGGVLALGTAACTGSSTPATASGGAGVSSNPTTEASATTVATTTVAATSTATTSTTAASPTAVRSTSTSGNTGTVGVSACQTRNLSGSVGQTSGAAGSFIVTIVFKNIGGKPCTLQGYPGVSLGAGKPVTQVGQPAARDATVKPRIVTLLPNGHAFAQVQIEDVLNYPASTCKPTPTTYLLVYPPNTSSLLYVADRSEACKADIVTLHVQAVQPGTGT